MDVKELMNILRMFPENAIVHRPLQNGEGEQDIPVDNVTSHTKKHKTMVFIN